MARSTSYYECQPQAEREAELDDIQLAGFQAGVSGEPANSKGLFGLNRTVYFQGFKAGQAAAKAAA